MEMKHLSKVMNLSTTRIEGLWVLAFDCESDSAEDLELMCESVPTAMKPPGKPRTFEKIGQIPGPPIHQTKTQYTMYESNVNSHMVLW